MRSIILLLLTSFVSATSFAEPIPEVREFVENEMQMLSNLDTSALTGQCTENGVDTLNLAVFRLRIQAELGFSAGIGQVSLFPTLEFFFE